MELINGIQIEVTQIVIKRNSLLNKRFICEFKRRLFIGDILSVSEESYLVESYYKDCSGLYVETEGWIKVKEPFNEIAPLHSEWWRVKTEGGE